MYVALPAEACGDEEVCGAYRLPPRVRPRETATGVFYRGTGNVPGPVYTPTGARTTDDRYPDFIPRPDETPSPNVVSTLT